MKVKYTPGTPDNKVGKTYKVEIIGIEMRKAPFIKFPVISEVRIQYEDGKKEWVDGTKFYSNILDTKDVIRHTH